MNSHFYHSGQLLKINLGETNKGCIWNKTMKKIERTNQKQQHINAKTMLKTSHTNITKVN
jgi:hypothetical protein